MDVKDISKNGNKKKRIIATITSIAVLLMVLGISYAYWRVTREQEGTNTLSTLNCLNVSINDETDAINLANEYPISGSQGMGKTPYTFTLTNECDAYVSIDIALETLTSSAPLNADYIRVSLQPLGNKVDNSKILSTYDAIDNQIGKDGQILKSGVTLPPRGTATYDLRIWIDYNATWEQAGNKNFNSKIFIIASPYTENSCQTPIAAGSLASQIISDNGGIGNIGTVTNFVDAYMLDENAGNLITNTISSGTEVRMSDGFRFDGTEFDLYGGLFGSNTETNFTNKVGYYMCGTGSNTPADQNYGCTSLFRIETVNANGDITSYIKWETSDTISNYAYGLFNGEDDDCKSYYYRGNHSDVNNWVTFAGYYWRIIRVDGTGAVRMIYNGRVSDGAPQTTGSTTQFGTSAFNTNDNNNAYVGYMYGNPSGSTFAEVHAKTNASAIKSAIDSWYTTNIASQGSNVTDKIKQNAVYCGDRSLASQAMYDMVGWSTAGTGIGTSLTLYGFYDRYFMDKAPSYKCQNNVGGNVPADNDQYQLPMGLVTADELLYAGNIVNTSNENNWLTTNENYWTMSPVGFHGDDRADVFYLYSSGDLDGDRVSSVHGLRGVLTLNSIPYSSGNGSISNPYVIN